MVGGSWKKHISVKGERAVEEIHQCERREDHGRNIRVKSGGAVEETPQCGRWEDWKKHFSV